jgi:peptidoglycan/LPS O-acetylase OafA/YrhL
MVFSVEQANDVSAAGSQWPSRDRHRLAGLDGIRGLAALFVVLHHCWLMSFPGYPANTGPTWTGWLVYGHLAVVVFIVLSGFSLTIAPARSDWQLGGTRRFFRRRAWRILPPYWAALILSLVIAWTLIPQPGAGEPTGKSVYVHGLLLQDIFGSPSPNGAFWSIAIEAQLYLVLPLMLLIRRRVGAAVLLGLVTTIVIAIELLSSWVRVIAMLQRLTPQMAVLFTLGVVAAGVVAGRTWLRRLPWPGLALLATVPVLLLILRQGPEWTVAHYFWVDLAVGPAVSLLLIAISLDRPTSLVRWLDTRPMRKLGSFSYSLYLTHAPVVIVVYHFGVAPHVARGVPAFLVTLVVVVPVTLALARVFASMFELPFQRHRSFRALVSAGRDRLSHPLARTGDQPA